MEPMSLASCITAILSGARPPLETDRFDRYWSSLVAEVPAGTAPLGLAVLGGALADRVAFAFAAGYQAAGRVLRPQLPLTQPFALCVTESGGGHPRAIETRLTPEAGGYRLDGQKVWTSMADQGGTLCVIASAGTQPDGRNALRLVELPAATPGVTLTPMPPTPFIPEIGHFQVRFDAVQLTRAQVTDDDAYRTVVKPFRTIEDLHVHAAMLGHLLAVGCRDGWPALLCAELIHALGSLADLVVSDALDPLVHLRTAGLLAWVQRLLPAIDAAWASGPAEAAARWRRDKPLLGIAQRARERRFAVAWAQLATGHKPAAADQ